MKLVSQFVRFTRRHSPEILSGVAVVGTVGTAVLTGMGTIKALRLYDEATTDVELDVDDSGEYIPVSIELTKTEVVALTWTCYIPAIVVGLGTITCIVGAGVINKRRNASLAGAYALLSTSFNEYRAKNIALNGLEADEKIRNEINNEHFEKTDIKPVDGKILFCDELSNHFWYSTMAEVIDAQLQTNKTIANNGEVSLSDYYEFLGIKDDIEECSEELGWTTWSIADEFNGTCWLDFRNRLDGLKDGREYYVIECSHKPFAFNYPFEPDNLPFN